MPGPEPAPVHTVAGALREASANLARAGIEGAGGDARRLLAAVLDVPAAAILGGPERALGAADLARFRRHVARRAGHEPVSRILGERDFYGRTFAISPATLDPRPDSETLIAAALKIAQAEGWVSRPLRILDVGTGSGCLLITLLRELPQAGGVGSDISAEALQVARDNAVRHAVAHRAEWVVADALESIAGPFHMLVANPPYVRTADIARLDREVRGFDPVRALDGGADGLDVYRRLLPKIASVVPNGWTVLEVGHDQAEAVAALLAGVGGLDAATIRVRRDVAGKRRCVAVRTRN